MSQQVLSGGCILTHCHLPAAGKHLDVPMYDPSQPQENGTSQHLPPTTASPSGKLRQQLTLHGEDMTEPDYREWLGRATDPNRRRPDK